MQEFGMVDGYMEDLKKNIKIGGWVLAWVWVLARESMVQARRAIIINFDLPDGFRKHYAPVMT